MTSSSKQALEDRLREGSDQDSVDMKDSTISLDKEAREATSEMYSKSSRNSSREELEVVEANEVSSKPKKERT